MMKVVIFALVCIALAAAGSNETYIDLSTPASRKCTTLQCVSDSWNALEAEPVVMGQIVDRCNGGCAFVPIGDAKFNPSPRAGISVEVAITGMFKEQYNPGARSTWQCDNYKRVLGLWIKGGEASGATCIENGGTFACPVKIGESTNSVTMDVPGSAGTGEFRSDCIFREPDTPGNFADMQIFYRM